jgi:hypothetical protein
MYGLTTEQARKLAKENLLLNKGVETLSTTFEEYGAALSDSTDPQYALAMSKLRQGVSDLLGLDMDKLSQEFMTNADNIELMRKAAEGDAAAVEELRKHAAADIILGAGYETDGIDEGERAILDSIEKFNGEDLTIGATLDSSQYGQELLNLWIASGKTIEDIQAGFDALGWTPTVGEITLTGDTMVGTDGWVTQDGKSYYVGTQYSG